MVSVPRVHRAERREQQQMRKFILYFSSFSFSFLTRVFRCSAVCDENSYHFSFREIRDARSLTFSFSDCAVFFRVSSHHSFHCAISLGAPAGRLFAWRSGDGWARQHPAHCTARDKWKSSFNKAKCYYMERETNMIVIVIILCWELRITIFEFVCSLLLCARDKQTHLPALRKCWNWFRARGTQSRTGSEFKAIHFVSDNLNCFLFGLLEIVWA